MVKLISLLTVVGAGFAQADVTLIAHRGGIVPGVPENTLAAFRRASAAGVDGIEIDLRSTLDGEIVVMHDATVDRTTDGRGRVAQLTLQAIRRLDAGGGERVPTFAEVLELTRATGVALLLDIKVDGDLDSGSDRTLIRVVELTEFYQAAARVTVGVRTLSDLQLVLELNPELRTLGFVRRVEDVDAFVERGVDVVRLWPHWIRRDRTSVPRLHRAGRQVWTTAGNAPLEELYELVRLGVDGILTDRLFASGTTGRPGDHPAATSDSF